MPEVMMIPFVDHYGDLEVEQVALFDGRDLTEEEAQKMIHSGQVEYTNKMVVMSKKQYETVFRSLKDKHHDNRIHAKWIDASAKSNCGKKCSHCGARITNREYVAGTHPFCHKCGAVMDNATEIQDEIRRRI